MSIRERLNNHLDTLVRPEVHLFHLTRSTYLVCGYLGVLLAVLVSMYLIIFMGLLPWVMAAIALAAVLTFLGLVMATKIITGEENIIYYHHEIAVMVVTTGLLWLLRKPVLPYLDVTILGIGAFLFCGRIGCLMVGCCHGRPYGWGVCYREEHAAVGFTPYFVGVRLFPVQALESLWVFVTVMVGSSFILSGHPQGEATTWYLIFYGIGRFWFEFLRGDPERPYYKGFSQPQWISAVLMCFAAGLEFADVLPLRIWHVMAVIGLLSTMIIITLSRRFRGRTKYQLLHAHHVKEVAEAISLVSSGSTADFIPRTIPVGCTSLGIQISTGKITHTDGDIYHYALSSQNGDLTTEAASALSKLILQLKPDSGSHELLQGNQNIFHLVIYPPLTNSHRIVTSNSNANA